jgi:uncharacterized protein DUF6748
MRIVLVRPAVLTALVAVLVALVGAPGAPSTPPPAGSSYFVVRPDPRLCPSPLCGGYWVSLANHARTRCHDGLLRPRCYVANAVDGHRHPLTAGPANGSLVRAAIERWTFEGFGQLGVLVVANVFAPAGRAPESGGFLRLVDTGIRCVRAPCFALRASRLNRSSRTTLSGIDIGAARTTPGELDRVEAALGTKNGVLAQGGIEPTSDGGRVFRATRFFLKA